MRGTCTQALTIVVVLAALASTAAADSWYFRWECAGACAPDRLDVRGVDGPYASEGDCDRAQRQRRMEINGPGSAGSATSCYTASSADAASGGGGAAVRPARLARAYVTAHAGGPWTVAYDNGTVADAGPTTGLTLEAVLGHQALGIFVGLGFMRAPGTAPTPTDALDPLLFYDLQLGFSSSPFAFFRRPGLEARPDLGVTLIDAGRLGCERCDFDVDDPLGEPEAANGLGVRLHGGLDLFFGRRRRNGLAVEAVYQRLRMTGDAVSAELTAPTWMFRVSWIRRGADYAAY